MEENKEVLELLKQIEKTNRQQLRTGRMLCILALTAAVCCCVMFAMVLKIVPLVEDALPQVSGVMTQMQSVLGNLEQTTGQLASLDLESMVADVDNLVRTGQQGLEQSMEKLNSIDFDTLNQAIDDLSAVIEPLAKISSLFK